MSRILHLVNMGLRYGRSKGVREHRLEEPPLGNLAVPCHLEESSSHHVHALGTLPLREGGGVKQSPPDAGCDECREKIIKMNIFGNHYGSS